MNKLFKYMASFILFVFFSLPATVLGVHPSCLLEKPVYIQTDSLCTDMPGVQSEMLQLTVAPMPLDGNAVQLGYYYSGTKKLAGNLIISDKGNSSWDGWDSEINFFQDVNLFIVPGFTIPVDLLPVALFLTEDLSADYEFAKTVNGSQFVTRIRISSYSVASEQALQSKWLQITDNIPLNLRIIEAMDLQTGNILIRQLWEPDSSWWVYEETPYRRSWRMP